MTSPISKKAVVLYIIYVYKLYLQNFTDIVMVEHFSVPSDASGKSAL